MSDTRAAIRELRTLSEKRSLGALSEAEAARWLALRRQLGLPLEPVNALAPSASVPGPAETPPAPSLANPAPEAGTVAASEIEASTSVTSSSAEEAKGARPIPLPPSASHSTPEDSWAGPALVAPAATSAASWGGPSLDAPAWSDAVAERPTDPGLDEPPPVPFDEAPAAARPPENTEVADFGGSPDERVPLAAAAEFVSYAREGQEAIDLPAETGAAGEFEPQSLAQLAGAGPDAAPAAPGSAAEEVAPQAVPAMAEVRTPEGEDGVHLAAELQREASGTADLGVYEGVLPEPPLEPASPEALGMEPGLPPPLGAPLAESLGVFEGVVPEPAPELEAAAPEASRSESVLSEPSLEPGAASPEMPSGDEDLAAEAPVQLVTPLEEAQVLSAPGVVHENGFPEAPPPSLSTWAPGAVEPPVLATDDFERTGDPLGERGLDPWPEALAGGVSADDVVETVGDEDVVVEELSTPTPLPPFPAVTPPGSGGIRGFQFPKPPPRPVPTPPTSPGWQRTQPGEPPFARGAVPPAAVPPAAVAPRTPPPAPPHPPVSISLPVPPPPPPRVARLAPVAQRTPVPTPPPPKPIPPSAVAPVTPRPTPGPGAQVPRPVTPVPGRFETLLAPPAPSPARAPVPTAATRVEEETQPLLDLVDEVEPPRPLAPPAPARLQPTPSPSSGTASVFGPPMLLNPSFVEGDHRVVIHTLEGQVHRGTVHNLDLQEDALAVQQPDGRSVELPTRRLKAVFFVLSPGEKPLPGRGERVQVTFRDGRQVVGYSDDHASGEPGFFVVPSDARTNTARVYVFRGGVQSITTG
jgi:hypothetical protein